MYGAAMSRPRLLDLFCGAGGAGMGYHRAGFEVVGIDIAPMPRYPFEFHQADAMTFPLDGFDAVHASPPCQDHSSLRFTTHSHETGHLLPSTIERLRSATQPWVVENVPGVTSRKAMRGCFTLCGRSFGIPNLKRHRLFLTSFQMLVPPCACGNSQPIGIYGDLSKNRRAIRNSKDGYIRWRAGIQEARDMLDCQWMDAAELSQAIPPVYTQFIGEQLLAALAADSAVVS